jgi:transcription elongation factor Elf1
MEKIQRRKIKNDKRKIRNWLKKYKMNHKCEICGESHFACLEFHHKDPNYKNGNITSMISKYTEEEIKKELEKCIILCSNCHKKLHYDQNINHNM